MRILCVSDSHGDLDALLNLLTRMTGQFDLLLHLGDGAKEMETISSIYPMLEYAAVRGNCDIHWDFPTQQILFYQGVKLLMTHGHLYGVKGSLELLRRTAQEEGTQLALFGHTHQPYGDQVGNLLLFNPGTIAAHPYGGSYGLLTLAGGKITRWGIYQLGGALILESPSA